VTTIFWGRWRDYPKVVIDGKEYAKVGDRLYYRHAVDYLQPSGRRTLGNVPRAEKEGNGFLSMGRGVPPLYVEEAILHGTKEPQAVNGVPRVVHRLGELEVVTEDKERIVVTVSYRH
jgi:filamentous hemagglutinin